MREGDLQSKDPTLCSGRNQRGIRRKNREGHGHIEDSGDSESETAGRKTSPECSCDVQVRSHE